MSKRAKIWLITAGSLVIAGLIMLTAAMAAMHWNFAALGTVKKESVTYQVTEEFSDISIESDTADITLIPAEDGMGKVVCDETENKRYTVSVENGTLVIRAVNDTKWYHYVGISAETQKVTVYLPETEYRSLAIKESTGNVTIPDQITFAGLDISASTGSISCFASVSGLIKIKTSTGDIRLESVSAGAMDFSVSTGKITVVDAVCAGDVKLRVSTGKTYIAGVACKNVISDGSTGEISLKNVIATEKISIERSTGDVKLDGCDAAEIFVQTDSGEVFGALLTDKVFIVQTDTGRVDVPKTITGGKCEIITDTGDICIKID